jgi:hypothetical protein
MNLILLGKVDRNLAVAKGPLGRITQTKVQVWIVETRSEPEVSWGPGKGLPVCVEKTSGRFNEAMFTLHLVLYEIDNDECGGHDTRCN